MWNFRPWFFCNLPRRKQSVSEQKYYTTGSTILYSTSQNLRCCCRWLRTKLDQKSSCVNILNRLKRIEIVADNLTIRNRANSLKGVSIHLQKHTTKPSGLCDHLFWAAKEDEKRRILLLAVAISWPEALLVNLAVSWILSNNTRRESFLRLL